MTNKDAWILAIPAALGLMLGGRAEAASTLSKGITVKTGVTQGGDPQFTNYIDIFLNNDAIPAYSGGGPVATVTITGLTGVSSVDSYRFEDQYLPSPEELIGTPPLLSDADGGTAGLQFFNLSPISTTDQILLVRLVVITPPDTPQGLEPGDTFHYTWTIGTTEFGSGSGTVVLGPPDAVPEPSSIVLMLAGGAVLPYVGLRHRRRRRSRGTA
jgi:hypothetical protein